MGSTSGIAALGALTASLRWDAVDAETRNRLELVVLDTLGVIVAGARTPELTALRAVWAHPAGTASVLGAGTRTDVDTAAWMNGIAACCLELDEGSKHARGHPAAHVLPAVLALAQTRRVSGPEVLTALLLGHEVAARMGRAVRPRPGLHPHGHWGAAGAAAGAARLLSLDGERSAAAIDAACGLPVAGHFESALRGSAIRNTWIAAANVHGLVAARLASAGLAANDGTAALTLGELLGTMDAAALTHELGTRWDVRLGYLKRHASCSFTHPPADAVLDLLEEERIEPAEITTIEVATHHVAAPLDRTAVPTRLAAMFSIPFVVAAALVHGACPPSAFDDEARRDPRVLRLMARTRVVVDDALDARLPDERAARVTVGLRDGSRRTAAVPNPVGDADYLPLDRADVLAKVTALIGEDAGQRLAVMVAALPDATDAAALLEELP